MGLSIFQTSTLGMMSQAHGLNNIGNNIANVSTGGYKRTDTRFTTMLSNNLRTGPGSPLIPRHRFPAPPKPLPRHPPRPRPGWWAAR